VSVQDSIAASRSRFEAGLQNLRINTAETGNNSRASQLESTALPLLWRLQDALLQVQLAKNAGSRFSGEVSLDSRIAADLTASVGLIGSRNGTIGRLDLVARNETPQEFRLAQFEQ
jgi:hypothetical protein